MVRIVGSYCSGPVVQNPVRDRSLIMGEGGGLEKGGGLNYFCLNWGRPQTEKYVTWGDPICENVENIL